MILRVGGSSPLDYPEKFPGIYRGIFFGMKFDPVLIIKDDLAVLPFITAYFQSRVFNKTLFKMLRLE